MEQAKRNKLKLPAIICDRDGVLKCGERDIPFVNETLGMIRSGVGEIWPQRFEKNQIKIPFYILTNGGKRPEHILINTINQRHKLFGDKKLLEHNLICNYTPMKEKMAEYKDKLVLVSGSNEQQLIELSIHCGLNRFLTTREYVALFP